VRKDGINSLLDDSTPAERNVAAVREKLYSMITSGSPVDEAFANELAPACSASVREAAELAAGSHSTHDSLLSVLHEIRADVEALMVGLSQIRNSGTPGEVSMPGLYHGETVSLAYERWSTIAKAATLR
jgi:hypothetical protein